MYYRKITGLSSLFVAGTPGWLTVLSMVSPFLWFFFYAHFFKWRPRLKNRKLTAVSWISVLQSNNLTVGSKIITVIEKGRRMNLKWTKGIRYVFSLKENDCKSLIVKVQLVWCTSVVHLCLSFPYFIFRSVCFWIPVYAAPAICKLQGKI